MLSAIAIAFLVLSAEPVVNRFEKPIPGSYIVRVKESVDISAFAQELQQTYGGELISVNKEYVPTIVVSGWRDSAALEVASDERVDFVDENAYLRATDTQQLRAPADVNPSLDRIDQRESPPDRRFRYPFDGLNRFIYVVDTGVSVTGTSFAARVTAGRSFVGGLAMTDSDGHGTAMASVAAGTMVGAAKAATIVPVKVSMTQALNLSFVEDGLRWILTQDPGVVNLSFETNTTGTNTTLEQLVNQLHLNGFVVVASAGNANRDTATVVPARVPAALTVGAIAVNTHARWVDRGGDASNFGAAVDLFAPGAEVRAERPNGTLTTGSGTSPAAAFTSGTAASLLQTGTLTPSTVTGLVTSATTPNVLTGLNGSANRLLFSDIRPATVWGGALSSQWVYCTWGTPQWRERVVQLTATAVDASGNFFLASVSAEPSFCTSATFITPAFTTIEKRSPIGAVLWSRTLTAGWNLTETVHRAALGPDGDLYLAATTGDCGGSACQSTAGLVTRLSAANGQPLWTHRFETAAADSAVSLQFGGFGVASAVHVVGSTAGVIGAGGFGGTDVFLARLDAATGAVSAQPAPLQFGTAGNDVAHDVTWFNQSLVIAGSTTGVLGSASFGGKDAFFATVLAVNGGVLFHRVLTAQLGTAADDEASAVVGATELDSGGNAIPALFAAGRTRGAFAGSVNQGGDDAFHVRLDDLFVQVWLFQHGTAGDEPLPQLAAGPDDLFIAAGTYLLKASRVSGLAAWTTAESPSRRLISAESNRHIHTAGGTGFERRRAF